MIVVNLIVVNLIVVKLIYHHGVTNVTITRRSRQGEFRVKQAVCLRGRGRGTRGLLSRRD